VKYHFLTVLLVVTTYMFLSGCNGSGSSSNMADIPSTTSTSSSRLNDTGIPAGGISRLSDGTIVPIACPDPNFPGQDADFGRDSKFKDNGDGDSGFSFTKLDSSGNPLDASAQTWACVRDNVTGLLWETKTSDGGLMDGANTYTWYKTTSNGSATGTPNGGNCSGTTTCDTSAFIEAINARKQCGSTEWRLPNVNELLTIAHYWKNPGMPVDTRYFPDQSQQLWTDTPHPFNSTTAWSVWFKWGVWASPADTSTAIPVRLVSGKILAGPNTSTTKFVDNHDGTTTDTDTDLVWMRCVIGTTWNGQSCVDNYIVGTGCGGSGWGGALNQTKCLNASGGFAGHRDWRLPNIKELASIVQWESSEHFSSSIFPNISLYTRLFSSSPYNYSLNSVWAIEQSIAEIRAIDKSSWGAGLLVRGGQ